MAAWYGVPRTRGRLRRRSASASAVGAARALVRPGKVALRRIRPSRVVARRVSLPPIESLRPGGRVSGAGRGDAASGFGSDSGEAGERESHAGRGADARAEASPQDRRADGREAGQGRAEPKGKNPQASGKPHRGDRHGHRGGGKDGRSPRALQGRPLTSERGAGRDDARADHGRGDRSGPVQGARGPNDASGQDKANHQRAARDGSGRNPDRAGGERGARAPSGGADAGHGRPQATGHTHGHAPGRRDGQDHRRGPALPERGGQADAKARGPRPAASQGASGPRMEQGRGPGDAGLGEGVEGGWRPLLRSDGGRRPSPGHGRRAGVTRASAGAGTSARAPAIAIAVPILAGRMRRSMPRSISAPTIAAC